MITFKNILNERVAIGTVIYCDINKLYPEEAITTYGNFEKAKNIYLDTETTQLLIKKIKEGERLTPIEVTPFRELSVRDKEFADKKFTYTISDGHHRYFAYLYCGIKNVLIEVEEY